MSEKMSGAAVEIDLTPAPGCEMDGYADRAGPSVGVHDPITGQIMVLESGERRLALVTLDLIGVELAYSMKLRSGLAEVLETDPSLVMIACTHTHSGPAGFLPNLLGLSRPADDELQDMVEGRLLTAAEEARRALQPVQLSIGRGEVEGIGSNRNDPGNLFDSEVLVMRMDGIDGEPAAVWMNFGCHPTVLSAENLLLSADFPGAARETLKKIYPGAVFLHTNGASGDVSTRFMRREQTFREVTRMGRILAGEVLKVMQCAEELTGTGVNGITQEIMLPYRDFPSSDEALEEMARCEADLEDARSRGMPESDVRRVATTLQGAQFQVRMLDELAGKRGQSSQFQVLRIGDLALVGLPGEPFTSTVLDLKKHSQFPWTGVLSYTNDEAGYFPDTETFRAGTYEAFISPYCDTIAEVVASTAKDLLERIKNA